MLQKYRPYLPRMFEWLVFSVLLLCLVAYIAPQQLPVYLTKLSQATLACVLAYWLDRALFPYSRPDSYLITRDWREFIGTYGESEASADFPVAKNYHLVFCTSMLRRAIIIAAVVLAVCLGL